MSVREDLKAAIKRVPGVKPALAVRDRIRRGPGFVRPGHFYSPIPDLDEVRRDDAQIFAPPPRTLPGIELHEEAQLELVRSFEGFYREQPFGDERRPGLRYYFDNDAYRHSDAIFLYCMIRHAAPRRIVEVGSGFSSALTLDTVERFVAHDVEVTFIEPYPKTLRRLLREQPARDARLLEQRLQDVPLRVFETLAAGDILFVDSTHVSRVNSDVNRLLFEILPRLAPGVLVHFHDVFYPFEYPRPWVYENRAWNEAYALRAFLQYNRAFRVVLMNTFLEHFHRPYFEEHMPLCLVDTGGSLWLVRTDEGERRPAGAGPPRAPAE